MPSSILCSTHPPNLTCCKVQRFWRILLQHKLLYLPPTLIYSSTTSKHRLWISKGHLILRQGMAGIRVVRKNRMSEGRRRRNMDVDEGHHQEDKVKRLTLEDGALLNCQKLPTKINRANRRVRPKTTRKCNQSPH